MTEVQHRFTAFNESTGDLMMSKKQTEAYKNNYDTIFGVKEKPKHCTWCHGEGKLDLVGLGEYSVCPKCKGNPPSSL